MRIEQAIQITFDVMDDGTLLSDIYTSVNGADS